MEQEETKVSFIDDCIEIFCEYLKKNLENQVVNVEIIETSNKN